MKSFQTLLLSVAVFSYAGTAVAQAASNTTASAASSSSGSATAAAVVTVDGKPVGAAEAWSARPLGKYDLTIVTSQGMLAGHMTVSDSLGKMVAQLAVDGEGRVWLDPTINGPEFTLVMLREKAPITLHLFHRGDRVSGTWTIGNDSGTLQGARVGDAPPMTAPAIVTGPAEAWNAKPVGAYRVVINIPGREMPAALTVKEVNGKLAANLWPDGDNDGHDLSVAVNGTQLLLTGETPHGPVSFVIEHRGPKITGTWEMGDQKGTLTGDFAK